jgi:predicted nucleic acid-binding protein/GNAT superfamily N-acetyltransferase
MRLEFIDLSNKYLDAVISLGTKHSNTLGFMPVGGFHDHARKRWIIIAHKDNELLGYLLFRLGTRNSRISIAHLCVKPEHRGKQIAFKLLDHLKSKYEHSSTGIMLSCRKDYIQASKLWEKYGFVSKNEVRSRSVEEKYLIKWWYDFNKTDLFSFYEQNPLKIRVLLDTNIVIKLRDSETSEHEEVKALLADWIHEEVEYYFAPELFNEIHRDKNRTRAEITRKFIQARFIEARLNKDDCLMIRNGLINILPGKTDNDNSDRKQLAECISSGIEYFITGDEPILSKRDAIEEAYNITILNPLEFVLEIDRIISSSNYHPIRLAGATHTSQRVDNKSIEKLIDKFLNKPNSESKLSFKALVNRVLQNVKNGDIRTVTCPINGEIAFWGYIILQDAVEVPFFRLANNNLKETLFTQLISEIVSVAIEKRKPFIRINDNQYSDEFLEILSNFGFVLSDGVWLKIALSGLIASKDLLNNYPYVSDYFGRDLFEQIVQLECGELKTKLLYEIERKLFPLKFSDLNIPCYIVPIKPYWAGQLFDRYISSSSFFGAVPEKIWNRENVYYRNVKPVTERAPARILWYASTEKGFYRQNAIVAVSYLDNVSVDLVKKQYSRFKKYGIYSWGNVYQLAKNNIDNQIKALNFSDTEVFQRTIQFPKITEVLLANNRKRNTFTSPLEVNNHIFNDVYKLVLK